MFGLGRSEWAGVFEDRVGRLIGPITTSNFLLLSMAESLLGTSRETRRRNELRCWRLTLLGLLGSAFALRMLALWLFPNIHHADDVYQYQAQAFRLIDG